MLSNIFYYYDEYNVKNYRNLPILLIFLCIFFTIIYFAGGLLLAFEAPAMTENVTNLADAIWLCYMAASTIGFGDFYPVTLGGRVVVGSMFLLGAVMLGIIIGLVHNMMLGWLDTSVKNRELRQHVQNLTDHNEKLESYLLKLQQHNEMLEHRMDILMEHVDKTTPELEMKKV